MLEVNIEGDTAIAGSLEICGAGCREPLAGGIQRF